MNLSIIIINYKTPELTAGCIKTVLQFTSGIDFEVIVVDNASGDGVEQLLKSRFPTVKFIQMGYNAGFARANNEGIRQSDGEMVLLLNSDTILEDNAIGNCYSNFVQSDYVACTLQILNPDRSPQPSGFYVVKGGLNFLLHLPYLGNWIKFTGNSIKFRRPILTTVETVAEVDWVNGAFLMTRKTVIAKAGLMDEDFFLYAEEAEWCSRLKRAGKLIVYGGIHIIHIQAGSSIPAFQSVDKAYDNIFDKKGAQLLLSSFVRIRKEFGPGWFFLNLAICYFEIPVFFIGVLCTALAGKKHRYTFNEFSGYVKNLLKTSRFIFQLVRNKPYFYKLL